MFDFFCFVFLLLRKQHNLTVIERGVTFTWHVVIDVKKDVRSVQFKSTELINNNILPENKTKQNRNKNTTCSRYDDVILIKLNEYSPA